MSNCKRKNTKQISNNIQKLKPIPEESLSEQESELDQELELEPKQNKSNMPFDRLPLTQSTEQSIINKVYVEIIFFGDTFAQLKSYYEMTPDEYENLKTLHIDIYIENFINDETLTKEKLDIHNVSNMSNINLIKNFISIFGNPFDILGLIHEKKHKIKSHNVAHFVNLDLKFSDSDNEIDSEILSSNSTIDTNSSDLINDDSDDSDKDIMIMTEIIDTYNKSKKIDKNKMNNLTLKRPDLLEDQILSEINTINS
jgi:hypothetical protein